MLRKVRRFFMIRALLVEDSESFRGSLKEMLHSRYSSMSISEAANGKEALREVRDSPPDLIFMDIRLPGENGLSLTRKIKTDHPNITIVILTSYDLPEYREAAFQYEADYFIAKNSPLKEIFDLVETVLLKMNIPPDRALLIQ